MREIRSCGSVRGVLSNRYPYRDTVTAAAKQRPGSLRAGATPLEIADFIGFVFARGDALCRHRPLKSRAGGRGAGITADTTQGQI